MQAVKGLGSGTGGMAEEKKSPSGLPSPSARQPVTGKVLWLARTYCGAPAWCSLHQARAAAAGSLGHFSS